MCHPEPRCPCCGVVYRTRRCHCDQYGALPPLGRNEVGLVCQIMVRGSRCFKCPKHDPHTTQERAEAERDFLAMLERLKEERNA